MNIKERIQFLCKKNGVTSKSLEEYLGFGRGYISKIDKTAPNLSKLKPIADYFGVTVDYLLSGNEEPKEKSNELTMRDERDISRRLEQALDDLEGQQEGLMFDGEPLDDETKELLKISLENSIRIAKLNAKQKFTPKKYRKTGDN
ncbi:helix-turn-helix domain-containing protein [Diplocloster agilis]|uniref:Helix-turn-helix transcriptional regulator n=1 Tax=Diplocloster agilis TaxID=2850323 RepID=A0A949K3W7_9FIRM|nr:helix-turn-helix transcriptional regulator [Diplocloster agilis]MBU9739706.1 helix-turn-helix transcriptional regulator [Diplocloster agilis]